MYGKCVLFFDMYVRISPADGLPEITFFDIFISIGAQIICHDTWGRQKYFSPYPLNNKKALERDNRTT